MSHRTSSTRNDYELKINYDWPNLFSIMAKQATIFTFLPVITDTLTHKYINRHKTVSKKK